jgi:hypothetical protein
MISANNKFYIKIDENTITLFSISHAMVMARAYIMQVVDLKTMRTNEHALQQI